jgi:hypothetical protein
MKHLILAFALILPLSVGAFKPEDLKRLKETDRCLKCDLSDANLRHANLYLANLADANLWGANLADADLWKIKSQIKFGGISRH